MRKFAVLPSLTVHIGALRTGISDSALRRVADSFDAKTFRRGRAYAEEGRVSIVKGMPWPIVAKVRGTEHYVVTVHYNPSNNYLSGDCSCPVNTDCKHAAATAMLAFNEQVEEAGDDRDLYQEHLVGDWLAQLGTHTTRSSEPSNKLIAYILSAERGLAQLSFHRTTRLKRGGFGRSSNLTPFSDSSQAPRWIATEDLRLMAIIRAVSKTQGYQSHLPVQALDSILLKEIAETQRLFWEDVRGLPLTWGAERTEQLEWCESEPEEYRLTLRSKRHLIPARECHYVDPSTQTIGPLDLGISGALVERLVSGPAIPESMLATAKSSLQAALPPEAAAVLCAGEPVAEPVQAYVRVSLDRRYGDSLRLAPEAHYGSERFILGRWGEERPKVVRNLGEEGRLQGRLEELLDAGRCRLEYLEREELIAEARYIAHTVLPTLQCEGWQCELDESVPSTMPLMDADWVEELQPMSDGHSWFELGLGVSVAGKVVPLLPILLKALRDKVIEIDVYEFSDKPPRGVNLELPDGELVHVPGQQLLRWLRPLVELRLRGLDKDESLVIPAVSAVGLAEESPGRFSASDALSKVRDRLAELLSLAPKTETKGFQGTLRAYQRQGLAWLCFLHESGYGGLLADDMGLGKTVQLLAFVETLRSSRKLKATSPILVVAPRSVVGNWHNEAQTFTPKLSTMIHLGPTRCKLPKELQKVKLVLTSYQTLLRDIELLGDVQWTSVIFDEAQALKNPSTKLRRAVSSLKSQSRFCVTGTPVENHLGELWSQVDLVMPGLLGSQRTFQVVFRKPIEKYGESRALELLRQRIRPFMLRRTKATVDIDLPEKTKIVERIALDPAQRDLYESLRLVLHKEVRAALQSRGVEGSSLIILDAMLRLRQCCCDPRLVKIPEARKVKTSAKLDRLMTMLDELADSGRFVLVFSQFTTMLDLIATECDKSDIGYVKLTGATRKREEVIARFQNAEVPVFLISLKAGGVGLNLTQADTVIHYDPWWNPAVEEQATDRAHRIGQTKNVMVYKLVAEATLEERICVMQDEKRSLTDAALHDGGLSHFGADDLHSLFQSL